MKITLNINYHTEWGESLYVSGSIPALGNGDVARAVEMNLVSPDMWQLQLDLKNDPGNFDYRFIVKAPEKEWRFEWGAPHRFVSGGSAARGLIPIEYSAPGRISRLTSRSIHRRLSMACCVVLIATSHLYPR